MPTLKFRCFRLLIVASVCLGLSWVSYAGSGQWVCGELLLEKSHALARPKQDSAVELELDMTEEVLDLFTTSNGKVSGLYGKIPLPTWFAQWVEDHRPRVRSPKNILWQSLDYDVRIRLLRDLGKARRQKFFDDRQIHGLVIKGNLTLKFSKKTKLLGKEYSAGTHTVKSEGFLQPIVEYMGPGSVKSASGVELHFRASQASGSLSNDAWVFLDALNIERPHQHIHIVAPLPMRELQKDPAHQAMLMAVFYANVNLAAEMISILEEGSIIQTSQDEVATYFAPLSPHNLYYAARYFHSEAVGEPLNIGDDLKMAWVGMRGSDKYDEPGLWGLEVRSIGENSNSKTFKNFLNQIQYDMTTRFYNQFSAEMKAWYQGMAEKHGDLDEFSMLQLIWYNQPWKELLSKVPNDYLSFLPTRWKEKAQIISTLPSFEGDAYKMLIFDWSENPMVHSNPGLAKQIKQSQIKAIKALMASDNLAYDSHDIVKKFLLKSGLFEAVMRSIGLQSATRSQL